MKIFKYIPHRLFIAALILFTSVFGYAQHIPAPIWHEEGQKANAGIGADVFVNRPDDVIEGDMILLIFTQTKTSTNTGESGFSTPDGFTRIHTEHATGSESRPEIVAFYKIADADEPAIYESLATDYNRVPMWKAFAVRITGQCPDYPIIAFNGANSGATSVSSLTTPSIETDVDNALLVHATTVRRSISKVSVPTNMTHRWFSNGTGSEDASSNAPALFGGTQVIETASTVAAKTVTWEGDAMATALSIAIRPNPVNVDLKIELEMLSSPPFHFADTINFVIKVTNLSDITDATDVKVNFMLPEGLGYVSHTTSTGICIPASGLWTIGHLAKNTTVTNNVIATIVCEETDYEGTAMVSGNEFDIDESNNEVSFGITPVAGGDNPCPVIANDDIGYGAQGQPVVINVIKNDKGDYDVETLSITQHPANGNLTISRDSGGNKTGEIVYLPNGNFSGTDEFKYVLKNTNGTLQDNATVYIHIEEDFTSPCLEATRNKTFYLPFPENKDQLRKAFFAAGTNTTGGSLVRNIISIKVPYPKTTIVYDHWEDGYESDITTPGQSTTQVWGDGDPSNGVAPGFPDDIIPAGGYIVLDETFAYNDRNQAQIQYDGKDKIYSTNNIFITKVTGDNGRFDVQNIKTDVLDVSRFGRIFRVGFGEDVEQPSGITAFKYVSLFIRAATDSTVVEIDVDGTGTNVKTQVLNEGEVWFYNGVGGTGSGGIGRGDDVGNDDDIKSTAVVTASEPVGVDVLFGDIANYGTRNIYILPSKFNSNEYITPVHTTLSTAPVVAFFTNNGTENITIQWKSGTGSSGSFVIDAGDYNYHPLSDAAGYHFKSTNYEPFTAMVVIDADDNGTAYDWAYPMIPVEQLTNYAGLAWAPGSLTLTANYNPIWVTALEETDIYVKWDGKMGDKGPNISPCGFPYDNVYHIDALESLRLINPNSNDQSGAAVFTCGTLIAPVWGQDAGIAPPSGGVSMDVGYVMQPGCLNHLIIANDDMDVTEPGEPVIIDVLNNDGAFLCSLNRSSLKTSGLLQPEYGSIQVNANGTITYTPNDDQWTGIDYFEYSVCAEEYPQTCDVALVTIKIIKCEDIAVEAGENIVKGRVFLQLLPEDGNYDGDEDLIPDIKVDLYADLNHNGVIDAGDELLESAYTDLTGRFNFRTRGNDFAADDFGSSESYSLNSGTKNWSNNWTRSSTTRVASVVDAVPDNAGNRAMRISGASSSASRSLTFTNATGAAVKFSYRRDLATQNNRALTVSLNSHTIYTIVGEDGDGKDLFYEEVIANIPSEYINSAGSNTLEFTTNSNTSNNDYFYIDNVELIYFPANFVVKISESNQTYLPSEQLNEVSYYFNGLGNCSGNRYLAVIANMEAMDDEVYVTTDTPTKIEILKNDLGNPDPSSIVITEQPTNGTLVINPDGTVTYFPNPGYDGNDSFKYTVCSIEDPNVCSDVATVTIHVQCTHVPGKNVINGMVFGDVDLNGDFDTGERGISGMQVELYDGADNLLQTTTTCEEGCYQFEIDCNEVHTVRDEFSLRNYNNNDGTDNWSGDWTEATDTGGATGGNIQITSAGVLRVAGNGATSQISVRRTADLTGSSEATLSFSFNKSSFNNASTDWVDVQISSNGTTYTNLDRFDGTAADSGVRTYDISSYISANTTVRFIESNNRYFATSEYVEFDDVQIEYVKQTTSTNTYKIKLASPLDGYILTTTPTVHTMTFTGCGESSCSNNFGLGASDLGVQKLVDKDEPLIGDTITFSIIVTNHGPSNNTGVVAVDELPSGYQFISQNKGSAFNQVNGKWDIGSLDVHKSDTLKIKVKVLDTGNFNNTATVTGDLPDPNPDNSTGTSRVSPEPGTDLKLEKTISSDPVTEGNEFTYTLTVTNLGPSVAHDIVVTDVLDDNLIIKSITPSVGTWSNPEWSVESLAVSGIATLTITAEVPLLSGMSRLTNTALLRSDTYDPNPANNRDTVTVDVLLGGNYWHGTKDTNWADEDNWTGGFVPASGDDIEFATTSNYVSSAQRNLHLDTDRIIGDLINDSDVDLIITQGNQLIIEGEVKDNNAAAGTILIKAGMDDPDTPSNSVASGTLIFNDPSKNTGVQATVEFYNQAYECANCGFYRKQWQYFGIPINEAAFPYQDPIAEIVNQWVETYNGNKWQSAPYTPDTKLQAFKGYEITNTSATSRPDHIYEFTGTLNVGDANLTLSKTGNVNYSGTHILANSFAAALPIDENAMVYDKDWTETVYLFNAGTRDQWRKTNGTLVPHNTRAGQYKAVPIHLAGEAGLDDHIPSMHSFLIQVKEAGTLTLKYDALQKNSLVDGKAWRVAEEKPELPYIVIDIMGEETADRVWLFENPATTTGYDKGWGALKMAETDIAQIYVNNDKQNYQVATVPEMEGTQIGLQPFKEDLYTINITSNDRVNRRNLYLYDRQTGSLYDIQDDATYPISVKAGNDNRFMIVNAGFEPKREIDVRVINKRIIISNPVNGQDQWAYLYSLTGEIMVKEFLKAGATITIGQHIELPAGAYILTCRDDENQSASRKVMLR